MVVMKALVSISWSLLIRNWRGPIGRIGIHVLRIEKLFHRCVLAEPVAQFPDQVRLVLVALTVPFLARELLRVPRSFLANLSIFEFSRQLHRVRGITISSKSTLPLGPLTLACPTLGLRLLILAPQHLLARTDIAAPAQSRQSFSGFKLCRLLSLPLVGTTPRYPVLAALRDLFSSGRRWQCA